MLTLVSYDVVSDARRDRVANALLDFGRRVQFSVFECHLDDGELGTLRARVAALIDSATDSVRYYRVCAQCERDVAVEGLGRYEGARGTIIV